MHQACFKAGWGSEAGTPARDGRNFYQLKARHGGFPTQNNCLKQHCEAKSNIGLLAGKTERETDFFFFLRGDYFGTLKKKSAVGRAKAKGKLEKVAHRSGQVPGCREG